MFALALSVIAIAAGCGSDGRIGGPAPFSQSGPTSRYLAPNFADVEIVRDVQYQSSPPLALDVYQPASDTASRRPVVIWMHGGGFAAGNKSEGPFIDFPTTFAKLGFVTVSIDYRLLASQQCIEPLLESQECRDAATAAIEDAQGAVRFLRTNAATYRLDPERIAIAGESAGAIAATGVGLHAHDDADRVESWISISGGSKDGEGVDATDSPGLLIAGTSDPLVPFAWSSATQAAMRTAGVPVVFQPLDGAYHVPVDQFRQLMLDDSRDFLYVNLHLESADQ